MMNSPTMKPLAFLLTVGVSLTAAIGPLAGTAPAQAADPVKVAVNTSAGKIVLQLNREQAPKTVANFLKYVENDFYEGTIFHRVIPGFMIQGGGLDAELNKKETLPPVRNEAGNGLKNEKYTVAMARTGDPHSATSQFFINTANNEDLNRDRSRDGYGYTVFGRVVEGQDVVDKISQVPTQAKPNPEAPGRLMKNVPVEPIVIQSVEVVQ